ncbi:hypothetical protein L2E82_02502 [Cichorium intybus]|uniref:Uncharacterized protein n=1 Tax=Cichorium intybus TaxID=13427 RepID=A0ACB9H1F8_CICIN|nr:hypothetical protein L2E82_02502 [Cichorium intybus]
MATNGLGLDITELRLGLPGGNGNRERNEKKRLFIDILGGQWEADFSGNGAGSDRKSQNTEAVIDVSNFRGYSDFIKALESLFKLSNECEYIPIYEDEDGDWMLVGDVAWGMFPSTCKRLRLKKRISDDALQTKNLMSN